MGVRNPLDKAAEGGQWEYKPALDAEEWAEFLDPENAEWAQIMHFYRSDHSAAATSLWGKPFGFTHADVDLLLGDALSTDTPLDYPARIRDLADRISALLPPRPAAGSGTASQPSVWYGRPEDTQYGREP